MPNAEQEITKLQAEIEERQARIRELRRESRRQQVEDLEAFEEMSSEERAQLYRDDPDSYRRYSRLKREKAERELVAEPDLGASR